MQKFDVLMGDIRLSGCDLCKWIVPSVSFGGDNQDRSYKYKKPLKKSYNTEWCCSTEGQQ